MQRVHRVILASPSKRWLTRKRASTRAKAKTIVRARAAAKPATLVARARTLVKAREAAQLTEANRLKFSDEALAVSLSTSAGSCVRGQEVLKLPPSHSHPKPEHSLFLRVLIARFKSMWTQSTLTKKHTNENYRSIWIGGTRFRSVFGFALLG